VLIRNHIGESGKPVLEYVAENDADREQLLCMMLDGEIPDSAAQSDSVVKSVLTIDTNPPPSSTPRGANTTAPSNPPAPSPPKR